MTARRAQAHWHPEAFDEPCAHDGDPSTRWPNWLRVTFLAVGLVVGGYTVLALIGAL
jgi:hypothetical protein